MRPNEGSLDHGPVEYSIHDDPDYALLLEFNSGVADKLLSNRKKSGSAFTKKDLLSLVDRFRTEINSLIVSEYFLNQASSNVWSETSPDPDDTDEMITMLTDKVSTLKAKIKKDFIERNENLLLSIVDTMVRLDTHDFVALGGLELLLLIYEKHKSNERYLNILGNCLCRISLESKYRSLFVQSG